MTKVFCRAGTTQIEKILKHMRAEHEREKVNAVVFVGDAVEEPPHALYAAAASLGVPLFMFQEGDGLALHIDQRGEIVVYGFAADRRVGLSRARAADQRGLRQIQRRRRQAARRVVARGRRVRGRRDYRARQSAHRQRAQTARTDEVIKTAARNETYRSMPWRLTCARLVPRIGERRSASDTGNGVYSGDAASQSRSAGANQISAQ